MSTEDNKSIRMFGVRNIINMFDEHKKICSNRHIKRFSIHDSLEFNYDIPKREHYGRLKKRDVAVNLTSPTERFMTNMQKWTLDPRQYMSEEMMIYKINLIKEYNNDSISLNFNYIRKIHEHNFGKLCHPYEPIHLLFIIKTGRPLQFSDIESAYLMAIFEITCRFLFQESKIITNIINYDSIISILLNNYFNSFIIKTQNFYLLCDALPFRVGPDMSNEIFRILDSVNFTELIAKPAASSAGIN